MDCSSSKETPPHKAWWTGETVAVVTGANRGIGHALAARLAEQGLSVVLTARDEARGEAAAAELRARGLQSVRFRRLDVVDPASVAAFASWVRDHVGGLDILIPFLGRKRPASDLLGRGVERGRAFVAAFKSGTRCCFPTPRSPLSAGKEGSFQICCEGELKGEEEWSCSLWRLFKMACPVCHAYCQNSTTDRWGVYVNNDVETFINIPCTIRDTLKHISGQFFNFKAHGHRYVLDVYRGHLTTVMGGNDWAKFVADFNLGAGAFVVFDTSKRSAVAYVAYLGNDGDSDDDIVEANEGAGVEVINIESDEELLNDDHEEANARELVYTYGCVLSHAERSLLDVVLTNNDGYIGSFFIHRLTTTNISRKLMKIPRKVAEKLDLPPVGVAAICLGGGECMNAAYHTDCDGRMVFNNRWGVFANETNLQEGDAIVFSFKPSNGGSMDMICVVHILRMPGV